MFERVHVKQLSSHIWLLDDQGEATGYLVVGRDRALIIDTMNGVENVRAIAETLTDRPLLVINTHGHCDHIYGNIWFDGALMAKEDLEVAARHSARPAFVKMCEENGVRMPPFTAVREGDEIDLGDLTAEVIALPGHTPGSICILLKEDRILFTGDAINRHLWAQLKESLPTKEVLRNLDRIAFVKEKADRILHGHAQDFEDISLYDKLREGLRQLCEQKNGEVSAGDPEYRWFGGRALQHPFDRDSVIVYTPEKLM